MAFLVVFAAFVAVALVGAWLGADTRPSASDRPEQQWPAHHRRG